MTAVGASMQIIADRDNLFGMLVSLVFGFVVPVYLVGQVVNCERKYLMGLGMVVEDNG